MLRIALFEPDIPQNTGTILRLGACLGVAVDIIEPCGFPFDDRRFRRAGMDYMAVASISRHVSFDMFDAARRATGRRLVAVTTRGAVAHHMFAYRPDDVLLLGRESTGLPTGIESRADAAVAVPMVPGVRSLNVAVAAALVAGEALRATNGFPALARIAGDDPGG